MCIRDSFYRCTRKIWVFIAGVVESSWIDSCSCCSNPVSYTHLVKEELTGIIDGFFRDGDIVGMAFFQAAGGDCTNRALFRSSSRSVSYTHLDVYERQVYCTLLKMFMDYL